MKAIPPKCKAWLSALVAILCLGVSAKTFAQNCPLTFSPYPAQLSSYVTVYPNYDPFQGPQQQLESWFLIDITPVENGTNYVNPPIPYGEYPAWCVDEGTFINAGYAIPGTFFSGLLYADCDPNLNSELPPGHPNTLVSPAVWNMVNYLLNNATNNGTNVFYWDLQTAINSLVGSAVGTPNPCGGTYTTPTPTGGCEGYPVYDPTVVQALLEAATNNAPTWEPICGDVIGAVYVIGTNNQFLLVEVPVPCTPCINVSKQIACYEPNGSCGSFGPSAAGYAGVGCTGVSGPTFCYQVVITNCGNVPLSNIVVSDSMLGSLTTNFVSGANQILQPGSSITNYYSMTVTSTTTNTVTVVGQSSLSQTVTNGAMVYTNGAPVSASSSASAVINTAQISCNLSLYSPYDTDGNPTNNNVTLAVANYYPTPPTVTLSVQVCNVGQSALNDVTISVPALANFTCSNFPAPFSLAAGQCQTFQLCMGLVSCPANMSFDVTVAGQAASDANHCGVYTVGSTNAIGVCSMCMGTIMCNTNTGCLAGNGNIVGSVLLNCNTNGNTNGDTGLSGFPVILLGATNNPLATNLTDVNGNYAFSNVAAGMYSVVVTPAPNYVETYPLGTTNGEVTVKAVNCATEGVVFGYADTQPPTITVTPGKNLGCNPTTIPTDTNVQSQVSAMVTCGAPTTVVTHKDTTNACQVTRSFTIIVTDTYGNSLTNTSVIYTWTTDTNTLTLIGVPTGKSLGCNPSSVPTLASVQGMVSASSDSCSTPVVTVTMTANTNSCTATQIFTIIATNACGNKATVCVTNTWTVDTNTLSLSGVPVGKYLGCNPTNIPTAASVKSMVSASDSCSTPTIIVTGVTNTNVCAVTEILTIVATNACGHTATASVTNTWTVNTSVPVITGLPTNTYIGCNTNTLPGDTNIISELGATDKCGSVSFSVTHVDSTNGCLGSRDFIIVATDGCGNMATTNLIFTWTITTPETCTNVICCGFNSHNPGSGWVWCNAQLANSHPGCNASVYCKNISVTLSCQDGKSYTFPCSNGIVTYSSACTVATNWFDGTNWNTVVPCNGDDQIFLAGCPIPWQWDFASCQSACFTGVFSCSTPGLSFNWQWGASCFANSAPSCNAIFPKPCHTTSCNPCGQYFSQSDYAGCPENHKPYCVAGGTGLGGGNYTGNCSGVDTTCTFTNGTALSPVLNGVPANDNLGCNPTNIPTVTSVLAEVSATDTCSPAPVTVTAYYLTNGCNITQIFTIGATNGCGEYAIANVTNTWMTTMFTNVCTNTCCSTFVNQNPGKGWVWCNAHISGKPGQLPVSVCCQNACITLSCTDGKTYTFPVSNSICKFATNCAVATNWFDGTNWNTTLPCAGDDQIFICGCPIPWQSDFANCQCCWTGTFSCSTPGFQCNWQFGAACYNNSIPTCANVGAKACHQTPCQNGYYFNQNDNAGCPENHTPYCVGGGTGYGGSNCSGNFSNPGACNF